VATDLFHADGQIDRHDEDNCRFSPSLQTRVKKGSSPNLCWLLYSLYRSFATRVSQLKIWHFWVISGERNVCRCTFNRCSAI